MVIVVTRVEEKLETTRVPVPFARKTVTNEALPAGATRLIQLGVNGEDEVTTRIVLENGSETERTEVSRLSITQPVDEIIAVGAQDNQTPVPLDGTLAYLSAGNAWVMRDTSAGRRPLTTAGDLDSRVFDLSPDGRQLLYSRRLDGDVKTPINQLWLANTTIVGEMPISLPIRGVVYAGWSPDGTRIAYSTAERTASSPGGPTTICGSYGPATQSAARPGSLAPAPPGCIVGGAPPLNGRPTGTSWLSPALTRLAS
jgi:hypothetical protein